MSLDVNKIIMQSLDEVVLSEGVIDDAKEKAKELKDKVVSAFKGSDKEAGKPEATEGTETSSVMGKAVNAVKEHPGIATAVAAALAAGVGGLMLRKKLKKAARENED